MPTGGQRAARSGRRTKLSRSSCERRCASEAPGLLRRPRHAGRAVGHTRLMGATAAGQASIVAKPASMLRRLSPAFSIAIFFRRTVSAGRVGGGAASGEALFTRTNRGDYMASSIRECCVRADCPELSQGQPRAGNLRAEILVVASAPSGKRRLFGIY